jgi:nucleoside-diphosphate-sugar epimerase
MSKLIVGCGYLGARVAKLWNKAGEEVHVVTRSGQRADVFAAQGLHPIVADVCDPYSLEALPASDTVLYSIGYDRSVVHSIGQVYASGLANVLAALPTSVKSVIYISTSGVYGPAAGEWVDERTPAAPEREGGKASLAAEQVLSQHPLGRRSIILRLAGIYGPGRIPYIDKLLAGEPLAVPSAGWLNLIHVDDAAAIVVAVDKRSAANQILDGPEIFCVSDGQPVIRSDYYGEVARLVGAALPRFIEADQNFAATQRARGDKRISSRKLIDTIQPLLLYPDYREGLAAILHRATSE